MNPLLIAIGRITPHPRFCMEDKYYSELLRNCCMSMSNCIIGPLFYWELWSKTRHSCWRGASKIVQAIISICYSMMVLFSVTSVWYFFTSPDEVDNISWSRSLLLLETSRIKLGSIRSLTSQATLFFNWPSKKLIKSMFLDFQKTKNWNVSNAWTLSSYGLKYFLNSRKCSIKKPGIVLKPLFTYILT